MLAQIEVAKEKRNSAAVESTSVVGTVESGSSALLEPSTEGVDAGSPAASNAGGAAFTATATRKHKATPVARRLASREGVDLAKVRGSGPLGRILKEDILDTINSRGNDNGGTAVGAGSGAESGAESAPQTLSTLRRTVVRNLEASWRIPAAEVHDFAEVDELVTARSALNRDAEGSAHPKLSFLPFFIKAAAMNVKRFPLLNAWYDEKRQTVAPRDVANIGFALDSEEGLVVPVVEGADRLTLSEIQELIDRRRSQAAARGLRIQDLRGGTFTISNYGSIGGTYGRPMILPPQVAILGLGRIHEAPVARQGQLGVAKILPLSFVFDHRVCDGSYAVRFLNGFIELITKPIRILR
jgi:pyruvate dehydrogenase E2 component (dihydrolipoamide acetyltransferase)